MIATIEDLVRFLKHFHRHWLDDPSLAPDLIPGDLPPGLATIYRELGALIEMEAKRENRRASPFAVQDGLVAVSRLKRIDGMVEIAWENQGNWSARCPVGQVDPPVYSNAADLWETEQRGFVVVCESLNHFLITLCLQEAVMGSRHLVSLRTDRPADQLLTIPVEPLWLNGYTVNNVPDHHFFVSADQDILVMDWAGLWIGSPVDRVDALVVPGIKIQTLQ